MSCVGWRVRASDYGPVEDPQQLEQVWNHGFLGSGSALHLLAAAEILSRVSSWKDSRDATGWSQAAAVVRRSTDLVEPRGKRPLLALATELLSGWQLRVRGIQAQRILEGMVVDALTPLAEKRDRGLVPSRDGG